MAGHALVIVESPAKAKTINKYLGDNYTVLASYGHVRDLPAKDGSVLPEENFAMRWELGERASKPVNEIKAALKKADRLILATDPDREGEAISWHLLELLTDSRALKDKSVERVTFNAITKDSIKEAFAQPRQIDQHLVEAYLARRALDYLVGFNISPVLWRKLPGARSAGRVQSVALRLVCEREAEIEKFRTQEYWSVEARLLSPSGAPFTARLTHLSGNKLGRLDIGNREQAEAAATRIRAKALKITDVEAKQVRRNPYAPFITSTLQQEASRKLGLGASETMRVAQRLYEGVDIGGETVGLITYMRTDGTTLSGEAVANLRGLIGDTYGANYVPGSPRLYKSKAKNAQEAHEAIRPTDARRTPDRMARFLSPIELKLYDLVWKRAVASQMESAVLDQVSVDISDGTDDVILHAVGSVIAFDGFLKLYEEGRDEKDADEDDRRLPPLQTGDATKTQDVTTEQHFTQPPPRYTEASLVKKLEEEGIGRPSTYASILQVLQDREYVRLEQKRFMPEDRGRLVTSFLSKYFPRYVDYTFTAQLEEELDAISAGHVMWKEALAQFWENFSAAVAETKDLTITNVIDVLDEELGPHFFPPREDGTDPRQCPVCKTGRMGLRLSRNGAFLGCSNYPECKHTMPLAAAGDGAGGLDAGPREIGVDVASGEKVSLRRGPYGVYVQLGEGEKPKRQGLPKDMDPSTIDLDTAMRLLSLPRDIGAHPESGEMIQAGIGRFGPYLKHGAAYKNLPAGDDVLNIGINRAVELLAQAKGSRFGGKGGAGAAPLRTLGNHPSGEEITVHSGRYGPYAKLGRVFATIPKAMDPATITLEQAIELVDKKAAAGGGTKGRGRKAAPAKAAKAKPETKAKAKPAAKKPAAKKAAAKPKAKAKKKA